MNIILSADLADDLENKYTVLELDTFCLPGQDQPITAFCLIENVGIEKMPNIPQFKNLHADLMRNYKSKNWQFCEQAIQHLQPYWGHEVGSFYQELSARITGFRLKDPGADWNGFIHVDQPTKDSDG